VRINKDVNTQPVNAIGAAQLKEMVQAHLDATGSKRARQILDGWAEYLPKFTMVYPMSEKEAPEVSGVEVPVEDSEGAVVA